MISFADTALIVSGGVGLVTGIATGSPALIAMGVSAWIVAWGLE